MTVCWLVGFLFWPGCQAALNAQEIRPLVEIYAVPKIERALRFLDDPDFMVWWRKQFQNKKADSEIITGDDGPVKADRR